MIAAVYGLQALIFIVHREFMLVGWMVVYLLSYVKFLSPSHLGVNLLYQLSCLEFLAASVLFLVHG